MVKAVAAAAKKSEHVVLLKQPDHKMIMVHCTHCDAVMVLALPASIPKLTKFLKKCEKDHSECRKPPMLCSHGQVPTACSVCEGHPVI